MGLCRTLNDKFYVRRIRTKFSLKLLKVSSVGIVMDMFVGEKGSRPFPCSRSEGVGAKESLSHVIMYDNDGQSPRCKTFGRLSKSTNPDEPITTAIPCYPAFAKA
jgi:hypothetical protein